MVPVYTGRRPATMNAMLALAEVRGAIFDVDDTLLDNGNRPGYYLDNIHSRSRLAAVHAVGAELGVELLCALTPQENANAFLRSPVHTVEGGIWQILLGAGLVTGNLDPAHELVREIARRKEDEYYRLLETEGKPVPGSPELVRALADYGIPLAIASNATRRTVDVTLAKAAITHLFPDRRIITTEQITKSKPDPEAFERAFLSLDLSDEDRPYVLGFEDDPRGIESARRTGLHVCAIGTRYTADELIALPIAPHNAADSYSEYAEHLGIQLATAA